jgi:hypothetical protein
VPGAKEADVNPQTSAEQRGNSRPGARVSPPQAVRSVPSAELSDDERRVLECLQRAGTGLTVKQLRSRTEDPPDAMEDALAVLVERRLVSRLNTLIPSYAYRQPDFGVHAD